MFKKIIFVVVCFLFTGCTDQVCIITDEISISDGSLKPTKIGLQFGKDCNFTSDIANINIEDDIIFINTSNYTQSGIKAVDFLDVTELRLKNLSEIEIRDEINRIKIINKEE